MAAPQQLKVDNQPSVTLPFQDFLLSHSDASISRKFPFSHHQVVVVYSWDCWNVFLVTLIVINFVVLHITNTHDTEVEIQLPLKRFPDSRVSSLIRVGWCEEGHPATKNLLQHSHE